MLLVALAVLRSDAAAQSLTLEYEQVVTRQVPGASAALALDPSRVVASARDGVVTLIGRAPGSTNVIIIAGDETVTLRVLVSDPPITILAGTRGGSSKSGSTGYYETRYGSDPRILQGSLLFSQREGDRFTELRLDGAMPFEQSINSRFSIPQASFTFRTSTREITLLDRVISHSPLTISRSNVRGLYLRQGPWQVNAGYSFFGTFEQLLLPTEKEGVGGIAYRHQITPNSSLTPNLFYFGEPTPGRRGGAVGTLLYEAAPASDVKFLAELGIGRAVGGALDIELDRPNRRAWAKARFAPPEMPSLTTDQPSGTQLEAGWIRQSDKSNVTASVSSRRYSQARFDQTSSVASFDVQRWLTKYWTIHGGSAGSVFGNASPTASSIRNLAVPVGTSLSGRNVGGGVEYQFSRETTRDLGGHLFRVNVNGSGRGLRVSAFGERQTQAPTAQQIFTEIPWLAPMLDRLGLAANTPQQLADLLRTNAELSAYGYANTVRIDMTPVRTRMGASGGWSGAGGRRPQLSFSTLLNRDQSTDRTALGAVHSITYSQRFGNASDVFLTWSALCHDRFVSSACRPVLYASLRRALNSSPRLLFEHRGAIEGIVFRDDRAEGIYLPGLPTLSGVEIALDNVRYARTDSSGRFRFDDVPYGRHRVEARYTSKEATFFTTPSPADVDSGSSVYFGVALSRSSLRGVVLADAGTRLNGVLVRIIGVERETTVRTADDGTFIAEGLPAGEYDVRIEKGSVPAGYAVDALAPLRVRVEDTAPGRAEFVLRPYRSVTGRARVFDRESGQYVALAGATVEILSLRRQSLTDENGQYAFRNLPAGELTIVAKHDSRTRITTVSVPEGPALVKDIDLDVLADAAIADARLLAGNETRAPISAVAVTSAASELFTIQPASEAFTIQVAESNNARHARAMVAELKVAGHNAYLEQTGSGANGSYFVRVGRYSTRAEADRSARTLEKALGWRMLVTPSPSDSVVARNTVGYVR